MGDGAGAGVGGVRLAGTSVGDGGYGGHGATQETAPTLPAASAASVPACPARLNASRATRLCTDGVSLVPLLRDPDVAPAPHVGAYSQVPRGNASEGMPGGSCSANPTQTCESYMGCVDKHASRTWGA
jgi:hypothetical protein